MHWLMHEWMARLLAVRSRLVHRRAEPDAWFLAIRERVLGFLIVRYRDHPPELPAAEQDQGADYEPVRVTVCLTTAEESPPRQRSDLRPLLVSIRRHNENKRGRWRWWL